MGQRVELTTADKREIARAQAQVDKEGGRRLAGSCGGCGRGIPVGYLARVTKWQSVPFGPGFPVQRPAEMLCKDCEGVQGASKPRRRVHEAPKGQQTPSPVVVQAKEIARKLLFAMSDEPHGSRRLCQLAGLEYTDLILPILRKLRAAGKVRFEEGRWARV